MKTETEGLSREEFEKQLKNYANQYDGANERAIAGFGFMAGWEARAASSLKQAEPGYVDIPFSESPCKHSSQYAYTTDGGKNIICLVCEFEGKQAEPPSQLAKCPRCGQPKLYPGMACYGNEHEFHVAESTSQASTQPPIYPGAENLWPEYCKLNILMEGQPLAGWWGYQWAEFVADRRTLAVLASIKAISQATKEEWARRIAEASAKTDWLTIGEVLALMTNESPSQASKL